MLPNTILPSPRAPQVLFKMVLGSAKFGEAALFLTVVGGANFVFISFVPVILYFTHVEYFASLGDIPWAYLCGVAGLLFGMDACQCSTVISITSFSFMNNTFVQFWQCCKGWHSSFFVICWFANQTFVFSN